jgi:hypothetical protein
MVFNFRFSLFKPVIVIIYCGVVVKKIAEVQNRRGCAKKFFIATGREVELAVAGELTSVHRPNMA